MFFLRRELYINNFPPLFFPRFFFFCEIIKMFNENIIFSLFIDF